MISRYGSISYISRAASIGLVDADIRRAAAQPVHVREAQEIEIGDLEGATDPFERKRDRRGIADRQPEHADAPRVQRVLLRLRDLVAVARRADGSVLLPRQNVDEPRRPGI